MQTLPIKNAIDAISSPIKKIVYLSCTENGNFLKTKFKLLFAYLKDRMNFLSQAAEILSKARATPLTSEARLNQTIALAALLLQQMQSIETRKEKEFQLELSKMMEDPKGKEFTFNLTDQCFRSQQPARIVNQLRYLLKKQGIPKFLAPSKRFLLWLFERCATWCPPPLCLLSKKNGEASYLSRDPS